jgi:hypothetical protein
MACEAWGFPSAQSSAKSSATDWLKIGTKAAEVRSLGGVMRFTKQPVYRGRNELRLWLY